MEQHAHQVALRRRRRLVRRRERVVDHVDVGAVGRDGRRGVKAAVSSALDGAWRSPRSAAVGRFGEEHVWRRNVAAHEAHDDAIGGVRSGRCAVGDVNARSGGEVAARAGDAVDRRSTEHRIDKTRLGHRTDDVRRLGPRASAVNRLRQEFERLMSVWRAGGDSEDVGNPEAVGAHRAAVERVALAVVSRRSDLVLRPRRAAIARGSHLERSGDRVRRLLLTAEVRPADVDVAEERARRGIVGPDLLLVREDRARLL